MKMNQRQPAIQANLYSNAIRRILFMGFLVTTGFAVLFLTYLPAMNAHAATPPTIEISPRKFDFGQVTDGSDVEHDFLIKNVGSEELNITEVITG